MFKQVFAIAASLFSVAAMAQNSPLWMRFPAISPDGQTVAFSYKGDLWTVPVNGGQAHQLTTNPAYEAYPVWSSDSRQIAFASTREGSMDVYVVSKDGGAPRRLTTDSGDEFPMAWSNDSTILLRANIMPSASSIIFAGNSFPQVYEVCTSGGRMKLFSTFTMQDANVGKDGSILFHDQKGYEDQFRKHHQSPVCRDIWLYRDGRYTKLTDFAGEDRTPVWGNDTGTYYYLSEEDGTFNVYKRRIGQTAKAQLTHFKGNPVRFLSRAVNGTLCFGYNGGIYTLKEGSEPQKLNITVTADDGSDRLQRQVKTTGATEFALSPGGKEIAFVVHGDVYVTSIDYKTTRQITDTPEQERNINFSPDGRSLVYAAERNGLWQIYQTSIVNKNEKQFTYATDLKEEQLVKSDKTSMQPAYSPDGKSVAFIEDRGTLKAVDVRTKAVRTLMDGKYQYSYADGDLWYQWSPDSRWLLSNYIGTGGWNNSDIALVPASGKGAITNLTNSGYNDVNGRWVLGGKAMLFQSDRAGYRSHGSWGAEDDAYIMFFDLDAYERFRMNKEERALYDEAKKDEQKADSAKKKDPLIKFPGRMHKKNKDADENKDKEVKPLKLDLANCRDRVVRLTVNSSLMGDAILSTGGDTLYYQAQFEGGYDLWKHDLVENKTEIVMKGVGASGMEADKDFKHLYIVNNGVLKQIDLSKGSSKNVDFEARFNYRPYEERAYIFRHVWQQVKDKFYDPNLHGVDWEGYKKNYEQFLPYINNNYDFRDLLSEMLGELNGSHTGSRYYPAGASLKTAALGLFFDNNYAGDGLKVEEVIKRGPFDVRNTGVAKGCIIEKIDGGEIKKDSDYTSLLDGKAGQRVRVSVYNPKTKKHFDVTIRAISRSDQTELLYRRWVDRNRRLVDSLSHGTVGYVHVQAMDSKSFRTVFSELLSDTMRQKKSVIVDERHNGGGWLHDDLCTLLSGKQYAKFIAHGKYIGYDPWNKWVKPSCVLICEDDYSNGHGFPAVYKILGIGKLVGTPVAGTMTAVWWERMMNGMVFGIPQVGNQGMDGTYFENKQLNPDIEVYNTPEDFITGNDRQLKAAVEEMMKQ